MPANGSPKGAAIVDRCPHQLLYPFCALSVPFCLLFCGNGLCIKKTRLFWTYGNLLMDSRELSGGFGGLHDVTVLSYHQPRFFMRRLWHSSQRLRDGERGASTKAQPLPRQTFCRPRCLMDPLIRPAREKGVFLELA